MPAQLDDQGLVQTDPRNIAVPDGFVNMIPTDIRGLTFSRTPQMVRGRLFALPRTSGREPHLMRSCPQSRCRIAHAVWQR